HEPVPVLVPHPALHDVEHQLEIDVDVGSGHTTGRDGGDVHGEPGRAYVLPRHADLVVDAVPVATVRTAAHHADAVAAFDHGGEIDRILAHRKPPASGACAREHKDEVQSEQGIGVSRPVSVSNIAHHPSTTAPTTTR